MRQAFGQGFRVAQDHGQKIVEVVRDAAGELSDRLELLRLAQPGVEFAPLGDVEHADDHADGGAAASRTTKPRSTTVDQVPSAFRNRYSSLQS